MKRSDATAKGQCPFEPSHLILHARMGAHIEQCRKNYPNKRIEQCTFDANHWFHPDKRAEHYRNCEVVSKLSREQYVIGESTFMAPLPDEHGAVPLDDADNWNAPISGASTSYLEVKDQINRNRDIVKTTPTNVGKAQRRDFHQEEKHRFQQLQNNNQ